MSGKMKSMMSKLMRGRLWLMTLCVFCLMSSLSSCTLESSDNGDFDGYWHLERVDTLATNGILDLSKKKIFWGVQYKLVSCRYIKEDDTFSYYFRFRQTSDSITLYSPYEDHWHQDNGDNGGDIPVYELNDLIRSFGINNLQEPFYKEKLKGDKMILTSKTLRLYFRKF